jgi:prepilin-type N-terminal cleavage/methylation domain-containing protein
MLGLAAEQRRAMRGAIADARALGLGASEQRATRAGASEQRATRFGADAIHTSRRRSVRGFTLVELLLAVALLALLLVAVFQLLDRSLSLWRRAETRRSLLEQASAISDLMAHDLRGIEGGPRGDIVAEWVRFDTDGDGIAETKWPRIRLVRQASAVDVARVERQAAAAIERPKGSEEEPMLEPASAGLIEVVWLVAPASTKDKVARVEGRLWRGERLVDDKTTKSFFAHDFFGGSNLPPGGATEEVSGGLLWMDLLFAAQTSIVHDGWKVSGGLESAATSWDAWSRDRPDPELHAWNEKAPGMPKAKSLPLLPRRVRIELEFERLQDRQRRTALTHTLELSDTALTVDDPDRIPREEESYVLLDAEWMQVTSVDGRNVGVKRGMRGTKAETHAVGALVHYGLRLTREVPVALYREDWNL